MDANTKNQLLSLIQQANSLQNNYSFLKDKYGDLGLDKLMGEMEEEAPKPVIAFRKFVNAAQNFVKEFDTLNESAADISINNTTSKKDIDNIIASSFSSEKTILGKLIIDLTEKTPNGQANLKTLIKSYSDIINSTKYFGQLRNLDTTDKTIADIKKASNDCIFWKKEQVIGIKGRTDFKFPNVKKLYNDLHKVFLDNYQLTKEDFEKNITEWFEEQKKAAANLSKDLDKYVVDVSLLERYSSQAITKVTEPKDFAKVYAQLDSLFKNNVIKSLQAIDNSSDKTDEEGITIGEIKAAFDKVGADKVIFDIDEAIRITVKEQFVIKDALMKRADLGVLIEQSINKQSSVFTNDQVAKLLKDDPENVTERAKSAFVTWGSEVSKCFSDIGDNTKIPNSIAIKEALSILLLNEEPKNGTIIKTLIDEIESIIGEPKTKFWEDTFSLYKALDSKIFTKSKLEALYKAHEKEILASWYKVYKGNFNGVSENMIMQRLLPDTSDIKNAFESNLINVSKSEIIKSVNEWCIEMQDAWINVASQITDNDSINKLFLDSEAFCKDKIPQIFTGSKSCMTIAGTIVSNITISNKEKIHDFNTNWNKGINALDAEVIWKDIINEYQEHANTAVFSDWMMPRLYFKLPSKDRLLTILLELMANIPRIKPRRKVEPKAGASITDMVVYLQSVSDLGQTLVSYMSRQINSYYQSIDLIVGSATRAEIAVQNFIDKYNESLENLESGDAWGSWLESIFKTTLTIATNVVSAVIKLEAKSTDLGLKTAEGVFIFIGHKHGAELMGKLGGLVGEGLGGMIDDFLAPPTNEKLEEGAFFRDVYAIANEALAEMLNVISHINPILHNLLTTINTIHRTLAAVKVVNGNLPEGWQVIILKRVREIESIFQVFQEKFGETQRVQIKNMKKVSQLQGTMELMLWATYIKKQKIPYSILSDIDGGMRKKLSDLCFIDDNMFNYEPPTSPMDNALVNPTQIEIQGLEIHQNSSYYKLSVRADEIIAQCKDKLKV